MQVCLAVCLLLLLVKGDKFYLKHLNPYTLYDFQALIVDQDSVNLHQHQSVCPKRASEIPMLEVVVVFLTPPLPEVITITRAIFFR